MLALRARLRDLQRAPESKKKRWLVASSAVSMIIVVFLWVAYLNATVPAPQGTGASPTAAPAGAPHDQTEGVGNTLSRGFSAIAGDLKEQWDQAKMTAGAAFQNLRDALTRNNQFSLETGTSTAKNGTSSPAETAPVPPASLPEAPLKTP